MKEYYTNDLAYIHDVGFGEYALKSAPGILEILARAGLNGGLVVDLGCGSGLLAEQLILANYRVLGIDISEPMIKIARKRAPQAEFQVASLFKAGIPPCSAVTSIGECLNYLFDSAGGTESLGTLFRRVYRALSAGGVFVFDIAEPGQLRPGNRAKGFTEGDGWIVLVDKHEDAARSILTRRIVTLRKANGNYRRLEEIHRQRLYSVSEIATELRRAHFRVRAVRNFGGYALPSRHAAFIARKVK